MGEPEPNLGAELVAGFREAHPKVVDLARLASVAAIVEPALLRRIRQELLPALDAGAEADLWFSPLTHVATATAWTMRTDVAGWLRAELAQPAYVEIAGEARVIVAEEHAGHSDMLQLEDTIIWHSVLGHDDGVEQAFQRVLATLDAAPEKAPDVMRWFRQAQRRVPPAVLASPPAARLSAMAALHVDQLVPDSVFAADRLPDGVGSGAPANLPTTALSVALTEDGLRFGAPGHDAAEVILPLTRPLVLEVGWSTSDGPQTRVIRAEPGTDVALPGLGDEVLVRTLAGRRFRLRRVAAPLSLDHALDMLQSLALDFHMRGFFGVKGLTESEHRALLGLDDELDWTRYEYVRTSAEGVTGPVRAFLDGGANPLSDLLQNLRGVGTARAVGGSAAEQLGLTWPSFEAYLRWWVSSLRSYVATVATRMGPELVHVGFAVPDQTWRAVRPHAAPGAMPEAGRQQMRSRYVPNESPMFTYDIERAAVADLIEVLAEPMLDAVAAAEAKRPPQWPSAESVPLDQADVFLSYARADFDSARSLAGRLQASEISVRLDTEEIRTGDDWRRRTEAAIRSSRVVVALLTPAYLRSDYAALELGLAVDRVARILLPVLHRVSIEEAVQAFPALAERQFLITRGESLEGIVPQIRQVLRAQAPA